MGYLKINDFLSKEGGMLFKENRDGWKPTIIAAGAGEKKDPESIINGPAPQYCWYQCCGAGGAEITWALEPGPNLFLKNIYLLLSV